MWRPAYFLFAKNNPLLAAFDRAIKLSEQFVRRTFRKYLDVRKKTGRMPDCPLTDDDIPSASKPLGSLVVQTKYYLCI